MRLSFKKKRDPRWRWHRWFAWHPIRYHCRDEGVWLEKVWRRIGWYVGENANTIHWLYTDDPSNIDGDDWKLIC